MWILQFLFNLDTSQISQQFHGCQTARTLCLGMHDPWTSRMRSPNCKPTEVRGARCVINNTLLRKSHHPWSLSPAWPSAFLLAHPGLQSTKSLIHIHGGPALLLNGLDLKLGVHFFWPSQLTSMDWFKAFKGTILRESMILPAKYAVVNFSARPIQGWWRGKSSMHGRERERETERERERAIYIYIILYIYIRISYIHIVPSFAFICYINHPTVVNMDHIGPYMNIHCTICDTWSVWMMMNDIPRRFWAPWPARQCPSPCSFPTWGPWGLNTQKETTIEHLLL